MSRRKLAGLTVALVLTCTAAKGETLTFVAQFDDSQGLTNNSWFFPKNWFIAGTSGELAPADRVPLADETAVITGFADAGETGVRVGKLVLTNGAAVGNGRFSAERLQMLSGSTFRDARVFVLNLLDINGTSCAVKKSSVSILGTASAVLAPVAPALSASLALEDGSELLVSGRLLLSPGCEIEGSGSPQNLLSISGLLNSTNTCFVRGTGAAALRVDNSGIVRSETGVLSFEGDLEWQSSGGLAQFQAATSNAVIRFGSPFVVPTNVWAAFTGEGVSRVEAPARIDGVAAVGGVEASQAATGGQLLIDDRITGVGSLQVAGNGTNGGKATWRSGVLSLKTIAVSTGGKLEISGDASGARSLSGCDLENSGLCVLMSPQLRLEEGAFINNLSNATFEVQSEVALTAVGASLRGVITNRGTFLKTGTGVAQFGTEAEPFGPEFNNLGLVEVRGGELKVLDGTGTGEFLVGTNASLAFWGGTFVLQEAARFIGEGTVQVAQGLKPAQLTFAAATTAARLEVGVNGTVVGPGRSLTNLTSIQTLSIRDNGVVSDGNFGVTNLYLLGSAVLTNSSLTVRARLGVDGTNCAVNFSLLTLGPGAVGTVGGEGPHPAAAMLRLTNAATVINQGHLALQTFGLISGGGLPESRFINQRNATLTATNDAVIRGDTNAPMILDNSGTIRVTAGTLAFEGALAWQNNSDNGVFEAATTNSLLLFRAPFQVPAFSGVFFIGPGSSRLAGGGNIDGRMQVGAALPGYVELQGNVGGRGTLKMADSSSQPSKVKWLDGRLSVAVVDIGTGSELALVGTSTNRELSGCTVNDNGLLAWPGQAITGGGGAVINVIWPGVLDIQGDALIAQSAAGGQLTVNNYGTLLKSSGAGESVLNVALNNFGDFQVKLGTLNVRGLLIQTGGSTTISAGASLAGDAFKIQAGTLTGPGLIKARVENGGVVAPDRLLSLAGGNDFIQSVGGALSIRVTAAGQNDLLLVGGRAQLNGELTMHLENGLVPQLGQTFEALRAESVTGSFSRVSGDAVPGTVWVPHYTGTNVSVSVVKQVGMSGPVLKDGVLTFSFPTTVGLSYIVQATSDLYASPWQTLTVIQGDGAVQEFKEAQIFTCRFFRVLVE